MFRNGVLDVVELDKVGLKSGRGIWGVARLLRAAGTDDDVVNMSRGAMFWTGQVGLGE
jgi:hypothetical protein